MSKKVIAAIAIYLGLVVACIIAVYAVPSVKGMLERTYIAEYGSIDVKDEVSAFIVRDETVYVAEEACSINRLADPDKLVKARTRVVELTPDAEAAATEEGDSSKNSVFPGKSSKYEDILKDLGETVKSTKSGKTKVAGYVCYYVDGAEARLSTAAIDGLSYNDLKSLTGRKAVETPKTHCSAGDPLFKVVKNARWYLVFYISNKEAEKYEPGEIVTIDAGGSPVEVTVSQVLTGNRNSRITLSCKTFYDGFLETRNLDTTVTVQSAEGLVLEDRSIVDSPDGRRGVFVKNKLGEHVFKPVKAKADDGTRCVVFSDIYVDADGNYVETIGTYDEIITVPTEEDMDILKKQIAEEEKARAKAQAEAEAKAKAEAEEQAKALEKAQQEAAEAAQAAADAQAQADAAAAEAQAQAQAAAEAQAAADAQAAEEASQ